MKGGTAAWVSFFYYYYIYNVGVFNLKYEFGQLPVNITNNSSGRKEGDAGSVSFFFFTDEILASV